MIELDQPSRDSAPTTSTARRSPSVRARASRSCWFSRSRSRMRSVVVSRADAAIPQWRLAGPAGAVVRSGGGGFGAVRCQHATQTGGKATFWTPELPQRRRRGDLQPGLLYLSDQLTPAGPPAHSEATQQILGCPVCYGSPGAGGRASPLWRLARTPCAFCNSADLGTDAWAGQRRICSLPKQVIRQRNGASAFHQHHVLLLPWRG